MPAPLEALRPGMGGKTALPIHRLHLADILVLVGGYEQAHGVGRRGARGASSARPRGP